MLNKKWLLAITGLFTSISSVWAQTVVSDVTALESALSSASAGDEIILADQVWTDVVIDINATGTLEEPITIKAQTRGSVFFEGNSSVHIGGEYIVFDGVVFQNPSNLVVDNDRIDPIIEFRDSDNNECSYCNVINVKIDSYNGTEDQKEAIFKWIILYGQYNNISYNSFLGKYGIGSIINDNRNDDNANYSKIHHNYFADRTPIRNFDDDNDQDAIRIGASSTSLSSSFTEVYNNYFDNFSGEVEIISNKSGANKYYNNTFRNYQGSLTLRHGNGCEVYNNYFFAEGNVFTAGVRVIGEDHKIYNNYIEGINSKKEGGSSSGATGGINVSNGREDTELNGYYQVIGTQIVNNTFVDCDHGIRIGTTVGSNLSLAPEDLTVCNNIFLNTSDEAISIDTDPITSTIEGNITQDGDWEITTGTDGNIETESGLLEREEGDDFYRVVAGSAAIDTGMGTFDFLTQDVLRGTRETAFDAGAEEYEASGTDGPYTSDDIGVTLGFGAGGDIAVVLNVSISTLEFGITADTETFDLTTNTSWIIESDATWLTVDTESGSGTSSITITVEENDEGASRSGTVTISTTDGLIVETIAVTQLNEVVLNLGDNLNQTEISIYPNPTTSGLININSGLNELSRIRLIDLGGKTLINTQATGQKTTLDLSQLNQGLYILNITGLSNTKIVVN